MLTEQQNILKEKDSCSVGIGDDTILTQSNFLVSNKTLKRSPERFVSYKFSC